MKTQYLLFSKGIDQESVHQLIHAVNSLSEGCDEVYLLINSECGNVNAEIHCYNVLRALPVKLITHNVGNIDSIANVIYLAGERRYASPSSSFMFHGVGFDLNGPFRLEEKLIRESLDVIVSDHDRIGRIFIDRSNLGLAESTELYREQRRKDPDWAIEKRYAHEISPPQIPPDARLHELT